MFYLKNDRSTRKLAHATPKQMEKLAAAVGREPRRTPTPGPGEALSLEIGMPSCGIPLADACPDPPGPPVRTLRLSEISHHIVRVGCRRCGRTVEIQKADAVRLSGPAAFWKSVGQRLLDDTCTQRTGRLEEDGCWSVFE